MKKTRLNITFNNPNTPEETAKALVHIFAQNLAYTAIHRPEKLMEQLKQDMQIQVAG